MSQIKVNDVVLYSDFAQANAFSAEPVAVLDFVNVSVDAPVMEESRKDFVTRKNAQSTSNNAGIEVMRKWIFLADSFADLFEVVFAPNLLEAHNIVITLRQLITNEFDSNIFVL
jgi:hypothetical protein